MLGSQPRSPGFDLLAERRQTGGLLKTRAPVHPAVNGYRVLAGANSVHVTPHQKFVSRNKVVNSSSEKPVLTEVVNLKDNGVNAAVKTPKSKGNYKIISKTKLVQTDLKSATRSKVQQEGVAGQSAAQTSKATTHTSPRVTTISRPQRVSPANRIHQTAPKLNTKKKYSVLSRTKLVRRQSGSGKAGTPGKPRYTVNTKNKLVRRRSSSGTGLSKSTSKIGESKAKTSGMPAKPKYSVITKNKLVRRRSSSGAGTSKSSGKISELKTKTYKSQTEGQKKFHVISQTKLVRRRSSSGAYKELSAQGLGATPPSHSRKRVIVKRHKLIRNVSSAPLKYDYAMVNKLYTRNVNTAFKVININPNISAKQRVARGIVSKYKINRLKQESYDGYKKHQKSFNRYKINLFKPESAHGTKRYRKYNDYSSKARQSKKSCASKRSDRFINIGGILYKSTKTSLRKQLPKDKNNKPSVKIFDSRCTVFLRGEKFHLTAGGRTLQRVKDSTPARSSLPRVHLGGLTYSRTRTGLYELTKTHQARAVLSSARQRSMVTLIQKRRKASFQKRNEYCVFFNRFGRCSKKNRGECPYIHDSTRVAICTRFLRGRCPVNNCPFSHTVDPHKMPVCSHFLKSVCTREDCPYRHVKVNPSAPVCLDFVRVTAKLEKSVINSTFWFVRSSRQENVHEEHPVPCLTIKDERDEERYPSRGAPTQGPASLCTEKGKEVKALRY
ncbi:Zinc finger CCCH domain-containing protein 3 [Chionoecetes opilio]|uniref:Zinc finger CCCH domain-containing protein 3 n=1 Tax=Chionoecetes opilio TaxID=41210 RepID=A0A8J4Y9A7_CHIOP|nr:Zinc finger CCCH domain-containing protein 3 [Chionoecetes opilio]